MFRPDIHLAILKIAMKMSFWCSKIRCLQQSVIILQQQSEVLQKLGYFKKKKKKWTNTCIKVYSGTAAEYILYSILFNLSATTKGKPLCAKCDKNRNSSAKTGKNPSSIKET